MKAEQVNNTQDALTLSDQEWERFIELQSEFDESGNDGNGLSLSDILAKGSRTDILKYLGWY